MSDLKAKEYKRFEDIKIIRADGSEYWPARELAPVLEYVLRILIKTAAGRIGSGHLFSFNLTSYSHPIRPKAGTSNPSINNSQTVSR